MHPFNAAATSHEETSIRIGATPHRSNRPLKTPRYGKKGTMAEGKSHRAAFVARL